MTGYKLDIKRDLIKYIRNGVSYPKMVYNLFSKHFKVISTLDIKPLEVNIIGLPIFIILTIGWILKLILLCIYSATLLPFKYLYRVYLYKNLIKIYKEYGINVTVEKFINYEFNII